VKTCIYTFSGTGTALSIAEQVRDVIGSATVKLIPQLLKNSDEQIKADTPKIGLVFPNYFGGIPNVVQTFIQKLDMDDVEYIFAIVPAGGGQGFSLRFLKKELQRRGKTLDYGRYATGPSNYIVAGYYGLLVKSDIKLEKLLASLREKTHQYAEEIKADMRFVERSNPFVFTVNRLMSSISSRDVLKDTSGGDKDYSASDKCTGCGICIKVCQANNIVMTGNKPSFQHECYRCMACMQYCPQNAVFFNGKELNKSKYTHPDYPAEKMIRRIQEDAQEQNA
jgi:NAD-dependent dihydropyrimidine dehydrogenase PreA subunit/flavodoxin